MSPGSLDPGHDIIFKNTLVNTEKNVSSAKIGMVTV